MIDPTLGAIRFERGIPSHALRLGLEQLERPDPVLLLGAAPEGLLEDLRRGGLALEKAAGWRTAMQKLSARSFHAVLVDPQVSGGIELVKAVKLGSREWPEAHERHLATPIVVLPYWTSGETEYAVIVVAPRGAFLEDSERLPIAEAVLRVDWRSLRAHSSPRRD